MIMMLVECCKPAFIVVRGRTARWTVGGMQARRYSSSQRLASPSNSPCSRISALKPFIAGREIIVSAGTLFLDQLARFRVVVAARLRSQRMRRRAARKVSRRGTPNGADPSPVDARLAHAEPGRRRSQLLAEATAEMAGVAVAASGGDVFQRKRLARTAAQQFTGAGETPLRNPGVRRDAHRRAEHAGEVEFRQRRLNRQIGQRGWPHSCADAHRPKPRIRSPAFRPTAPGWRPRSESARRA